ncbi:MAG: hypothetical protein F4Y57_15490 [Acidobacteria bacterium]|nr:hypothetical protein [Acidobacteriota bacterium]
MRDLRVAAAVLALAACSAAPAFGQTPDAWEPPRMPDGRPDLQGVWVNNVATPLQRLPAMADRSHLSEEEVAALEERAERIFANGRSAFTTPEGAFRAALQDVETYNGESTSSSIGMIDITFTDRTSLIVDPPDGRIPEQTELARARETAVDEGWTYKAGPEDLNNIHRCITTGVPRLGGNFGSGPYTFYQIVQTPTHLAFINEAFHDTRLIPLDDRPHLPEQIRQWNGDSRGHWDGDTLVVETKNFSPKSYYRGSTDGLHLVERFTRSGPDTLTYRVTLTDPDTWEEPWTVEVPLQRREQAIYEFACHEGNHSIEGMLKTARIEEDRP